MSRSNPPHSLIAEKVRHDSEAAGRSPARRRPLRRRIAIRLAALARWLHIYLSMFGLAAVLFFSVTGLTLNHPDWFAAGVENTTQAEGQMDRQWLNPGDLSGPVEKLEIVEFLRTTHNVRGAVADFRADGPECSVTFKGPGYAADAFIDRQTGRYQLSQTAHGLVAVINDLHKGRDTGPAWSVLIDVSAVLMTVISLTGLLLLLYLKLRRGPGLIVVLLGTLAVALVYWLGVP
jgi:hypothetical protein